MMHIVVAASNAEATTNTTSNKIASTEPCPTIAVSRNGRWLVFVVPWKNKRLFSLCMQYTSLREAAMQPVPVTKPQKPKLHIMHISLKMMYVSSDGVGQINKK
jgi:hypothetical protein